MVKREASVRDLLRLVKQKLIRRVQPRRIPFVDSLPDFIAREICAEYQAWREQKVFECDPGLPAQNIISRSATKAPSSRP
jgi:hypothetical protein